MVFKGLLDRYKFISWKQALADTRDFLNQLWRQRCFNHIVCVDQYGFSLLSLFSFQTRFILSHVDAISEIPKEDVIIFWLNCEQDGAALTRFKEQGYFQVAVYANTSAVHHLDACYFVYDSPHLTEWNLCDTDIVKHMAFDLDGVICEEVDYLAGYPDHHPIVQRHFESAAPLFLPRQPVVILTARPESVRKQTEAWLQRYRVPIKELIMWNRDPNERWISQQTISYWKAAWLQRLKETYDIRYYIESNAYQASVIASCLDGRLTVLCNNA